MKYIYCYMTKLGEVGIVEENHYITELKFNETKVIGEIIISETPLIHQAHKELMEYFDGKRKEFSIPLKAKGTPFQQKVWEEFQKIPYGETKSYKEIAKAIGSEKASGAIASVSNRNPLPIFIPSHRAITANGKLFGFFLGSKAKELLLTIEKQG